MFKRIKRAYKAFTEPEGFEWTEFVKPVNQSEGVELKTVYKGNFIPGTTSESFDEESNAVFFGEGTTEEWEDLKKEDEGTKPWYDRIKKL